MNKYSKMLLILIISTFLYACNEKTTRVIVGWSSMGDLVKFNDSVEINSVKKGIKNGDIVVINYGYNVLKKTKVNSVYRVVASPGDSVKINSIATYINGKILFQAYSKHVNIYIDSSMSALPSNKNEIMFKMPIQGERLSDSFPLPLAGSFTLKSRIINKEYYFLENDDYSDLNDSRFFGLIPIDSIVGVVRKIYHKR